MLERIDSSKQPPTDTRAVEQELVELWRQSGATEKPMFRSRVLVLVTVAPAERESEMAELMAQLAEHHPARSLLVLLDSASTGETLEADVALLCGVKTRSLCSEQIRLRATSGARDRLPGAVRALLCANLPVVLWWTLRPDFDPALYEQLAGLADHILLDSATLCQGGYFSSMDDIWRSTRSSDLNWERLTGWRELVARLFDAPDHRGFLTELEEVVITGGACPAESFLFAGWLASRLGWQIVDAGIDLIHFVSREGRDVTVRLQADLEVGRLSGVRLHAGEATFEVRRVDEGTAVCKITLPADPDLQQIVTLQDQSEEALVSRELDLMRQSRIYREAVLVVQELQGRIP